MTDVWIQLADTRDYADVAAVYGEIFPSNPPATSVIGFQPTGRGLVQIQVIAVKSRAALSVLGSGPWSAGR